jgi:histidine ammonia-lyase
LAGLHFDERGVAGFTINGGEITLEMLDRALDLRVTARIDEPVRDRIRRCWEAVAEIARGVKPAYGINTGFGNLCTRRIPPEQVRQLQSNLLISHAVGVGPAAPDGMVRWMMLLKIHAMRHGVSGVALDTLDAISRMLEADLLPVVPIQGSLGASGDLAPLAHMVLPLIGKGWVRDGGVRRPAEEAMRDHDIARVELGPKEGLALINGTQFICAYAAVLVVRARRLIKHADVLASMSLEGFAGSMAPFDPRLHALRPHRGAVETAENVRRLMAESEILQSHADCDRVQDPYSLRCVPQVHGASRDAIRHAAEVVETEINAVTDNPLIFDDGSVISGGGFHAQPLALVLDYLAIALAELASISERRIYLLLSGQAGLPTLLMQNTGINSGFMLPQYTAAALVSENKLLCSPASVDSIATSLGQEDHVSMGATAATKCVRVLDNTETVLAIEQMCAAQAIDYRAPLQAGVGPRAAHQRIRAVIPHTEEDRLFGDDIHLSLDLLRSQDVVSAVEQRIGELL